MLLDRPQNPVLFGTPLGLPGYASLTFEPVEIRISAAYDVGDYELRAKDEAGTETTQLGQYVVVSKKVDGEWKVAADIFNPNEMPRSSGRCR